MKQSTRRILLFATVALLAAVPVFGAGQIGKIIKILGVTAAIKQFGPQINRSMNSLSKHKDTPEMSTKVVTIYVVGVGKNSAVGAAQIMGPKGQIAKCNAVASPEMGLFGNEIRIRALIPVQDTGEGGGFQRVPGVAVSGIVDLKL